MTDKVTRSFGSLYVFEVRVVGGGIERTCNANTCDTTFVIAKLYIIDD